MQFCNVNECNLIQNVIKMYLFNHFVFFEIGLEEVVLRLA